MAREHFVHTCARTRGFGPCRFRLICVSLTSRVRVCDLIWICCRYRVYTAGENVLHLRGRTSRCVRPLVPPRPPAARGAVLSHFRVFVVVMVLFGAACCGFGLRHKHILYLCLYFVFAVGTRELSPTPPARSRCWMSTTCSSRRRRPPRVRRPAGGGFAVRVARSCARRHRP